MTPKSRSRVTNKPPSNRPTRSAKATARRVRDLFGAYLARLGPGPHDPIIEANALRWAELTVICEALRTRALAGADIDANSITRMESTTARVERSIGAGVEAAKPDPNEAFRAALRELERERDADHGDEAE